MRVGIITHNYPNSKTDRQNAGIFVYDVAHALKTLGHQVFVLAPKDNEKPEKMDVPVFWFEWAGKGKKLGDLKLYNPIHMWIFFKLLYSGCLAAAKFSRENNLDFIIGMWSFPAGIFAWWASVVNKTPYCLWSLGSDIYVYARYPILRTIIKMTLQKAKFLVADGIDLARETEKLAGKKCDFLPSASQLQHKSSVTKKKTGPLRFVFLGRMEPVKGPDVLIDALAKISDLDFELHMIGDGSLLSGLKERVKDLGLDKDVTFYGNVSDTNLIYKNLVMSDWLVIPSRSDSIPLVFSEGLKARLPMVVAEVGDMVELVKSYKVGLSFPKEDSAKLAANLRQVIVDGRTKISQYQEGINKLAPLFDINTSAKRLASIMEKSLKYD